MTAARSLTDADLEAVAALLRKHEDAVVDRVEARLRHQRPKAQRRTRSPELVAALAAEQVSAVASSAVDEVVSRKAGSALAKIRKAAAR